jgi:hypothetical protein
MRRGFWDSAEIAAAFGYTVEKRRWREGVPRKSAVLSDAPAFPGSGLYLRA